MKGDKKQLSALARFKPYFPYLLEVKWPLLGGIFAGVLYGLSSGAGLPLAVKVLFPILFRSEDTPQTLTADAAERLPSFLSNLLSPLFSTIEGWYQSILNLPQERFLLITCAFLPLMFTLRSIGSYLNSYWIKKAGFQFLERIRSRVFGRLQDLSLSFFNQNASGEVITKLDSSSNTLRTSMIGSINDIIVQPMTLLGALGIIIWLAATSEGAGPALIGMLGIPLAVLPIHAFGKKIRKRAHRAQKQNEELSNFVLQNIQSPLEVRAYNLEQAHHRHFDSINNNVLLNNLKAQKYTQLISPAIEVLAVLGLSGSIYLGVKEGMTHDTFTALALALFMAYEPVKKLGKLSANVQTGVVALDRLETILDSTEELPLAQQASPLNTPVKGALSFQNVDFAYSEAEQILRQVVVDISPGEIIALVGPSGSGKTTFMNLVPRFYDPTQGAILLDGVDLREMSPEALRDQIAVVPQMPTLFNLSISENIAIGKAGATPAEIQEAAKLAYAHDFIETLPQGYDTIVSEGGSSLSGGQRQRIAIARAFLKNAPILLLDEATSALDNESQEKITLALDVLMQGKTVLMIAHRESSLKSATRRIEFSEGRIKSA